MPHASPATARIASIDALRGFVILLMLVDHAREYFYLHAQVGDPMAVPGTEPALFFSRIATHLCAPVFVALTGLAAYLYGQSRGGAAASAFLFKRGLFLVVLEVSVISFAWTFAFPPPVLFLQVIWVIGLSMIALAALVHLPRAAILAVGVVIVAGHNLLDPIAIAPGQPGHVLWSILHDRGMIDLPFGMQARTSYPLLPWIGVIALGYAAGPWFAKGVEPCARRRLLVGAGAAMLAAFAVLRALNGYGEPVPWSAQATPLLTAMSFVNLTKYPPSLDFLLLTLGAGALLLAWFERLPARGMAVLAVYGGAPLFFYILHLYALHLLSRGIGAVVGTADPHGLTNLPNVAAIWAVAAAVAVPCWFACRSFGRAKRASGRWWMRYL